ncbi:MAG TPA: hypothetical protein VIH89_14620 [Candidatus Sulfotelmatobacter sp.]
MHESWRFRTIFFAIAVICLCAANVAESQTNSNLQQHLSDVYQGKTFTILGFYSGDHLKYDSSGHASDPPGPGDWTVTGVVQVKNVTLSGAQLKIEARRLHLGWPGGQFQELHDYDKEGNLDKDEEKIDRSCWKPTFSWQPFRPQIGYSSRYF